MNKKSESSVATLERDEHSETDRRGKVGVGSFLLSLAGVFSHLGPVNDGQVLRFFQSFNSLLN